jgi:peptidoglycan/xylan/chitin deacetylase (PgdA/CDA1 family)
MEIPTVREKRGPVIAAAAFLAAVFMLTNGCSDSSGEPIGDFDAERDGVPVVTYHYFREGNTPQRTLRSIGTVLLNLPLIPSTDYWTVSAGAFERQLKYLEENGYKTVTMHELLDHMSGRSVLQGKCVALTFDDGDRSVYRYAYPLLREYGMRGTLFVVTSRIGQQWDDLELCTIEELREMERSGVIAIESHTHDLHYKLEGGVGGPHPAFDLLATVGGREDRKAVLKDLVRSRRLIMHLFGGESRVLAWPFGFGSALSDSIAGQAGFEGICSLYPGTNFAGETPYFIKRYTITARTSLRMFRLMAKGRYKETHGP